VGPQLLQLVMHVPDEAQKYWPVGHVQTPPTQVAPPVHAMHAAPPAPQAKLLFPGRQTSPWQHPVGHEVASHTQAPPTQCCPPPQAGFCPHWQTPFTQESAPKPQATQAAPLIPQADADGVVHVEPEQQPLGHEVESHTQVPATQSCPAPHAGFNPHRQTPPTHASASGPQVTQVTPPTPQANIEESRHSEPAQQPLGQVVGSQIQLPFTHRWPAAQA
jgi:hypothetical protein